jgi:hypothetical protein
MQGYCVKCKMMREINDGKTVKLKTGMKAVQGTCTYCGTKITRITGK